MDSHTHSTFSADGSIRYEEYKKLDRPITITDHLDYEYCGKEEFVFNIEAFFEEYTPRRSRKLFLGAELNLRDVSKACFKAWENLYPLDFLLGSTHNPYAAKDNLGFYAPVHFVGMKPLEAQRYYLEEVEKCLEAFPEANSFAHIDYIFRYHKWLGSFYDIESLNDDLSRVFKLLREHDTALEINTYLFKDPLVRQGWLKLLKLYRDRGGEMVTIGSDAHVGQHLYRYYDEAVELVNEVGLKHVYFERRKPELVV